ncbi:histidine kinase [Actinobaculum sp. 352]|uniref:sensor histidine kinase n=1 Tax=Actinobaculum sp. 352 TaxID=2490946 RepID=UPI000F7E2F6D|nr:histidine kinase [Actinobaculum sp. 352]RTE50818.1 two-component sensor histidine kinase [Actinobaculum sp. 352]
MGPLADKTAIFVGCIVLLLLSGQPYAQQICWLLSALALSGFSSSFAGTRIAAICALAYLAASCFSPLSLPGMALVLYDLTRTAVLSRQAYRWLPALVPYPLILVHRPVESAVYVVVYVLAATLAVRSAQVDVIRARLFATRDDLQERLRELQDSNARLVESQDYEARAATLAERTRIARDIHDNVGHLLTRLIFRVKALQIVHKDDGAIVGELDDVGSTLDEALGSMRRSVHTLADEGVDLPVTLNLLGQRCGIDDVVVDCTLNESPPPTVAQSLIAVAREALTNAVRHGHARSVQIKLTDYPAFWQLVVENDGTVGEKDRLDHSEGMGVRSMRERVESLGGVLRIKTAPVTVFATIPKQKRKRPYD